MIKYIALLALIASARAASIGVESSNEVNNNEIIPLVHFDLENNPDGSFKFSYEGGDKSFREETGVFENAGTDDEALEVSGSYRYIDADGQEVEVHYTAGKNGFVPVGTNIPEEISAQAKAAAELPDIVDEGEEGVHSRQRRDVQDAEDRAASIIDRQFQKIEAKMNEKIDIQLAKINKKFERADEIIMDALS